MQIKPESNSEHATEEMTLEKLQELQRDPRFLEIRGLMPSGEFGFVLQPILVFMVPQQIFDQVPEGNMPTKSYYAVEQINGRFQIVARNNSEEIIGEPEKIIISGYTAQNIRLHLKIYPSQEVKNYADELAQTRVLAATLRHEEAEINARKQKLGL